MKYVLALPLVLAALAACSEKKPMTVVDFMENEVALYGTLSRCESDPESVDPRECGSAREAAQRLAVIEERALRKARDEAFQAARAEYRERLDRERALRVAAEEAAKEARLEALTGSSAAADEAGEEPIEPAEDEASSQAGDPADDPAEEAPVDRPENP